MQFSTTWMRSAIGAALALCCVAGAQAQGTGDWPRYSHDYANTNANPDEWKISRLTAPSCVAPGRRSTIQSGDPRRPRPASFWNRRLV